MKLSGLCPENLYPETQLFVIFFRDSKLVYAVIVSIVFHF